MQIPGLNLLNGATPPVEDDHEKPPSPPDTGALLLPSVATLLGDNPTTVEISQTVIYSGLEATDGPDFDTAAIAEKFTTDEYSIDLSTLGPVPQSADPLDIALAEPSEKSSEEFETGGSLDASDIEDASRHTESDDERLSDILETAQLGSLEGLEDEAEDLEDGSSAQLTGIRTRNEAVEDLGPIDVADLAIHENAKIEMLGTIEKVMGAVAIVRAHTGGEYRVLDEGAVVVTDTRDVLGVISETFGPVKQPRYVVRLVQNQVEHEGNMEDQTLFYVPDSAAFVFTHSLRGTKGSDASNIYDEEINDDEREFSDDEAEIEYRRNLKRKRGQERKTSSGHNPSDRKPSADLNHGLTYRPLPRPPTHGVPSAGLAPNPQASDGGHLGREYREQPSSRYNQPFATSSAYNREQSFPQPSQTPYNHQFTPYPVISDAPATEGYLRDRDYTSLPPGAYVNPAFFRPGGANGALPTPNISADAQRQMEHILSKLQPPAQ